MRHSTGPRRRAAGALATMLATALAAVALPLLAPAPADAATSCLSERSSFPLLPPDCGDDTDPPQTTILAASPAPEAGWIRATAVAISFEGTYDDADADPIGYECQLYDSPAPPATWTSCTSPVTYQDLEQVSATPYTFRVRAIDTADAAIDLTANPVFPAADQPDFDPTPAQISFRADATAPNTFGFLRSSYYDQDHEDAPMVTSTTVQVELQSNEGDGDQPARYRCRLDGSAVACHDGPTTLRDLSPGRHQLTAAAADPAGNVDPTPVTIAFYVPRDLTTADAVRGSGAWHRVRSGAGYLGGDYLESSTYGATLSVPARDVREIQLLAPAGPGLGTVQVRVGHGRWTTVRLASAEASRLRVHQVRDRFTGRMPGPVQIRVASHGRPVRVDAVAVR